MLYVSDCEILQQGKIWTFWGWLLRQRELNKRVLEYFNEAAAATESGRSPPTSPEFFAKKGLHFPTKGAAF